MERVRAFIENNNEWPECNQTILETLRKGSTPSPSLNPPVDEVSITTNDT